MNPESPWDLSPRRREVYFLMALGLLSLSVRLLFLAKWADNPLFHTPMGDEDNFHQTALALLGQKDDLSTFLYQPLYSFYLMVVYFLFGADVAVVRTLQLVIGTLTPFLFYWLGREMAGQKTARIAAVFGALYGPLVFFEGQLLAPGITIPLTVGALSCLVRGGRLNRVRWIFFAGLLFGLMLMGRPNMLVCLPVAGIWVAWVFPTWKRRLAAWGFSGLGLILGLCPSWIHNAKHGEGFVLISASGGHSFYLGNNPHATGSFYVPPGSRIDDSDHEAYRKSLTLLAEQAQGRQLSSSEVSGYWYGKGFEFWQKNPGQALKLLWKKFLLSFNSTERPIHHAYWLGAEIAPVLRWLLSFGIVFPFAVLGGVWGFRRAFGAGLLAWCGVAYSLTLLAFYVADRYRLMLLPMLTPLAALGLLHLYQTFKEKKGFASLWSLSLFFLAFAITQVPMTSPKAKNEAMAFGYNLMGKAAGDAGDLVSAEKYFLKAVSVADAGYGAIAWGNLGLLLEQKGRLREAHDYFLKAATFDVHFRFARLRLAVLSEKLGDLNQALYWWQELAALEADPTAAERQIERLKQKMAPLSR